MKEVIDSDYIATEEDILDYARFIGMDPQKDKSLLFIAKHGLTTPMLNKWYAVELYGDLWLY